MATGYQAGFPRWILNESMMCNSFECILRRTEQTMEYLVELHWSVLLEASNSHRTMQALWANSRPEAFRGVPTYGLSPEMQLLFLLVHAARHQWQGLKWLVDIHQICVTRQVNWESVAEKARELRWDHLMSWSLSVCHSLLDTPLSEKVPWDYPKPLPRLFPASPGLPSLWQNNFAALRLVRQPSEKILLLARRLLVPTPIECALWPLPESLAFLYYLLRPLRVIYLMCRTLTKMAVPGR